MGTRGVGVRMGVAGIVFFKIVFSGMRSPNIYQQGLELTALREDSALQLQGCLLFFQPQRGGLFVAF